MSVYEIEATREEMKQEALRRMEVLEMDEEMINAFRENELLYTSAKMGRPKSNLVFLHITDEAVKELIQKVEEEYGVLVYHTIWNETPFGEMQTLLFVSPTSSEWESENKLLADRGITYAYVDSEMESGISSVGLRSAMGGMIREQ